MALETFDGAAADLTTPWTQRGPIAWRRNGAGLAVPASTGNFALSTYDGAGYNDPIIITFEGDGAGDDYAGALCFFDPATGAHYSVESVLGSTQLQINYFSSVGNYVSTLYSFFTDEDGIGAPNQGAGDKLEVIPSLDNGNPHFEIYYTSSGGSRLLVGSFTDTNTVGRPTAENFGIYAFQGAGDISFQEVEVGDSGAVATLEQEGFRWRNDDGNETTATWAAAQDTNISAPVGENRRLRMLLNATGDLANTQYQLEYRLSGGSYVKVPTGATVEETVAYQFNAWDSGNPGAWDTDGGNIVDGNDETFGQDNDNGSYAQLTGNTNVGTDLGTITKVEARIRWVSNSTDAYPRLTPYFGGSTPGSDYDVTGEYPGATPAWSSYKDITADAAGPGTWSWSDVQNLDMRLGIVRASTGYVRAYAVEIRVTYEVSAPVSLAGSANITASGEATTAQLTAPSGKTTSDFTAGRLQDDENPADAVDIAEDFYTEMEWCLAFTADASAGQVYEFRVTSNGVALDGYPTTPTWTISSSGGPINVAIPVLDAVAQFQVPTVQREINIVLSPINAIAIFGDSVVVAVSLTPIDAVASFQSLSVSLGGSIDVSLPALDTRATFQTPSVRRAIGVSITALDSRATLQTLSVRRAISSVLPVIDAIAQFGGSLGVVLPLESIDARAVFRSPNVRRDITVSIPVLDATGLLQSPDVRRDITVNIPMLDALAAFQTLTVQTSDVIQIALDVQDARAQFQNLSVRRAISTDVGPIEARAVFQAPTVVNSSAINVLLSSINVRAQFNAPAVRRLITVALSSLDTRPLFHAPNVRRDITTDLSVLDARVVLQTINVRRNITTTLATLNAAAQFQNIQALLIGPKLIALGVIDARGQFQPITSAAEYSGYLDFESITIVPALDFNRIDLEPA